MRDFEVNLGICSSSRDLQNFLLLWQAPNIRRALDGELYFYGKALGFPVDMPPGLQPPDIVNLK